MANNAERRKERIAQEQAKARAAKERSEHLQEQQKTVREKKQKKKVTTSTYLLSGLATLCIASLGGAIWLSTTDNTISIGGGESNDSDPLVSEYAGVRGELPPADVGRQEAVDAAAALLTEAYVHRDSEEEYVEYLEALEDGELDEVSETVVNSVRTTDLFDNEQSAITSYGILTTYSIMIKQLHGLGEDESIEPLFDNESIARNVLYDEEVGIAYVPLSLFAGEQALLTMEMVYVDGEWQVMPYSLLEGVSLFDSVVELEDGQLLDFGDLE